MKGYILLPSFLTLKDACGINRNHLFDIHLPHSGMTQLMKSKLSLLSCCKIGVAVYLKRFLGTAIFLFILFLVAFPILVYKNCYIGEF